MNDETKPQPRRQRNSRVEALACKAQQSSKPTLFIASADFPPPPPIDMRRKVRYGDGARRGDPARLSRGRGWGWRSSTNRSCQPRNGSWAVCRPRALTRRWRCRMPGAPGQGTRPTALSSPPQPRPRGEPLDSCPRADPTHWEGPSSFWDPLWPPVLGLTQNPFSSPTRAAGSGDGTRRVARRMGPPRLLAPRQPRALGTGTPLHPAGTGAPGPQPVAALVPHARRRADASRKRTGHVPSLERNLRGRIDERMWAARPTASPTDVSLLALPWFARWPLAPRAAGQGK
jgi:hypothetical protein